MVNSIDSSLLLSNYQKKQSQTGSNILGKDDFLKLLMTQLQNQDPTNPMEDTDFIAQMAQFSTLEQTTNMNSLLEKLIGQQGQNQLITYQQFIGKNVTWSKYNDLGDGNTEIQEGKNKIESIQFKDNTVIFTLDDGTKIEPANIIQVHEAYPETFMMQASMMIGKTVTYLNDRQQELSSTVRSVSFKNGASSFILEDGKEPISANQIIKIE
ncbi:flagellar hook assembly protein FlgD [Niallia sp. Krafla_26]|uniref:flagellar hook assembly protein FlgD n=1 Tax=Niallia sp. Krafla_26 TaxID=3064703 RepID=UPI003D167EF3